MSKARTVFLRVSEIISIVDDAEDSAVVHVRDGREFAVTTGGAFECWQNIMDVIDPQSASNEKIVSNDPFVQFSLR